MSDLCIKAAAIVLLTHGFRILGTAAGPRWGGVVLGLPASTAIVLFFYGRDRGVDFAVSSADSALLGVVSAVSFALVLAQTLRRGRSFVFALSGAVAGFGLTALAARQVSSAGTDARILLVLSDLALVQFSRSRVDAETEKGGARPVRRPLSPMRVATLRTLVPIVCLFTVLGIGSRLEPQWAGLVGTFPCTLVAVLVVTFLESGPAATVRTAEAFTAGNFSMVAFIATLGACAPEFGLAGGMACGYLAAFLTLLSVEVARRLCNGGTVARSASRMARLRVPRLVSADSPRQTDDR